MPDLMPDPPAALFLVSVESCRSKERILLSSLGEGESRPYFGGWAALLVGKRPSKLLSILCPPVNPAKSDWAEDDPAHVQHRQRDVYEFLRGVRAILCSRGSLGQSRMANPR